MMIKGLKYLDLGLHAGREPTSPENGGRRSVLQSCPHGQESEAMKTSLFFRV